MKRAFGLVGALAAVWMVWSSTVEGGAFALPAERQYEMVSPLFKGGAGATLIEAVAPDGESAMFYSAGSFNGAPSGLQIQNNYLARRSSSGCSTVSLRPPAPLAAESRGSDVSRSLDQVFTIANPGSSKESLAPQFDLLTHSTVLPDIPANWELAGEWEPVNKSTSLPVTYEYASADLCREVFHSNSTSTNAFLPEAIGPSDNQLYEFDRSCLGVQQSLALVAVNNQDKLIDPLCNGGLGGGGYVGFAPFATAQDESEFNAMSVDGRQVFFTTCLAGNDSKPSAPHQVFVRLDGMRTLEVSRPLDTSQPFGGCVGGGVAGEVPCEGALGRASADFAGASEDGSTVYFTTAAALTGSDTDTGNDVYMATIDCPVSKPGCSAAEREVTSLVQVSHSPSGGAAEAQAVLRVAPNGRRVYYAAAGDLLSSVQRAGLEAEGRPVPHAGAVNLYVYDGASDSTAFIGDLCTGYELSGGVSDTRCPSTNETDTSLLAQNEPEVQTAGPDARFLVFATVAQLSGNDANRSQDVYRYDAETEGLQRVSVGEDGFAANGNARPQGSAGASIRPAPNRGEASIRNQYEMNTRAISEDGSRIVFTSVAPLSRAASNGLENAYEWHADPSGGEGSGSIVSTGVADEPVSDVVISPNGRSVFFVTNQGLVAQDTDGLPDIYDARVEGGFPPPPGEVRPCQGDACQGPLTNPAPLLVPGSVAQAPGENLPTPKAAKIKRKVKHKKKSSKKHRKHKTTAHGKGRK